MTKLLAAVTLYCTAHAQNIHSQQKSGARDPQAKSTQGKTTAKKGWRVTQAPDTRPLQAEWWHALPLWWEGECRRGSLMNVIMFPCPGNELTSVTEIFKPILFLGPDRIVNFKTGTSIFNATLAYPVCGLSSDKSS